MNGSEYKEVVAVYFQEILGRENLAKLDEIIHPDYVPYQSIHDPKALVLDLMDHELIKISGLEGIKRRISQFVQQFTNIEISIEDQIVEGDTLMVHYKIAMDHIGTWNNIPPTNLHVESYGFHLFKFKDEKILTITGMMNIVDILSQLGAAFVSEREDIAEYLDSIKRLLRL